MRGGERRGVLRETRGENHPMKRNHGTLIGMILGALAGFGLMACEATTSDPETTASAEPYAWPDSPSEVVSLEVKNRGTIRVGLYAQLAPKTVAHFVDLAKRGVYDDTLFHRVVKDFIIQGGNPGTRDRGPDSTRGNWGSLKVEDEYNAAVHERGVISMANRGRPGTATSQFFIVHKDSPDLDGDYTAFGRVLSGIEVVDEIAEIETDEFGRWGEKETPLELVILEEARVETLTEGEMAALAKAAESQKEASPEGSSDSANSGRSAEAPRFAGQM
jgi:peptidyl-prolyl cis-trans isomerase B (cyclophilin B)